MECPNCGYTNPEDAKFCQDCGQPLLRKCPNCGTLNDPSARFCKNCGFNLSSEASSYSSPAQSQAIHPSQDPRHARLAAAAPASLAEKIRSSAHLAGERRVVTALFADVVGSTALASQMDPEDWTAIMNRAFDLLVPAIYRYEGTIARLMGDALLAFFGAPVAHEDDPVRAVRAGLDLVATSRRYATEVRQRYGIDFALRVGLNTGPVVVGEVGTNLIYEYTAMGDAINLASRMQTAARPMTVLISEHTYRFIEPVFECIDLGTINVKGKQEPVRVYEVTAPKDKPGRVRGLAGLASPLVGREKELAELKQLSEAVQAGLGRVALILGEAGLGKSRLVVEWQAAHDSLYPDSVQWVEGHCLSYGRGLAYHLLIDLVRSLLGLSTVSSESETRSRLEAVTQELFGEKSQNIYPYLGHLLSLQLDEEALNRVQRLDPQALQNQYLTALRQFLQSLASRRPLVLILEDIHWADPSSIEALIKLLTLSAEAPILFCCLARPDRETPGWKLISAARELLGDGLTEITLQALTETDSQRMVSNLLEVEILPGHIRKIILAKAEGNPLFVEEVIRMLIDRGVIIQNNHGWIAQKEIEAIEIPDNLQGLLLARIDRLPEDVKQTLRVASVIGRQFSVRVLEQVLES